MKTLFAFVFMAVFAGAANAAIKLEPVEYKQGDTVLKGQLAYDDAATGKRPGIIVVHEWWGLNEYAMTRAKMLAEAGYVALAVDMFGDGKTTKHPDEAGQWAGAVRANQEMGKARFMAGYNLLKADKRVDAEHISAIGYCFGGGTVLMMAFAGTDLDAVVSFHGSLPQEAAPAKPTARMLICNGAADGFVTAEQIGAFLQHADTAGADWVFINYAGAKHGFTNPNADKNGIPAISYNEKADKRSWATALDFLAESMK